MTVITAPDASIVVPVNAQGDLENVLTLLDDLGRYEGPHEFESTVPPSCSNVSKNPSRFIVW